jgi:hypothetical protein
MFRATSREPQSAIASTASSSRCHPDTFKFSNNGNDLIRFPRSLNPRQKSKFKLSEESPRERGKERRTNRCGQENEYFGSERNKILGLRQIFQRLCCDSIDFLNPCPIGASTKITLAQIDGSSAHSPENINKYVGVDLSVLGVWVRLACTTDMQSSQFVEGYKMGKV